MSLLTVFRSIATLGKGVTTGLDELEVADDPIGYFNKWHTQAEQAGVMLPEAMTLATCSADGRPSARMVLLKQADAEGFVFFTNYGSRKAGDLDANPHAALVFHWTALQRQVRVEGSVSRTGEAESEAYYHSRPRGSQLGAWASRQSEVVEFDGQLEQRSREMEDRFAGENVPLPPFWGGYRLNPDVIEFWQGRASRLHDRLRYTLADDGWTVDRLFP